MVDPLDWTLLDSRLSYNRERTKALQKIRISYCFEKNIETERQALNRKAIDNPCLLCYHGINIKKLPPTKHRKRDMQMTEQQRHTSAAARGGWVFICLVFVLTLLIPAASGVWREETRLAVDPVGHSENYTAVLYNNTNGLPTSEANAVLQTSDGFLWIGCYAGLIRYDGCSFERMDSTTGVASVVTLFEDSRGRLWIGTNDSGLAMLERGELRMWGEEDGLASSKVGFIAEDASGMIYAGTTEGISMILPDMRLQPLNDPRIVGAYLDCMETGANDQIWCLTRDGAVFTIRDGSVETYFEEKDLPIPRIAYLLPDQTDPELLYIGTEDGFLYHGSLLDDGKALERVELAPLSDVIFLRQIGDQIWICARNGIGVLDASGFHALAELPMNNSVNHVIADYEGNLWFSSSRQGVMKLIPNRFTDLFVRCGLPPAVINSTCMYNGRLFLASDTGLTVLDESGPVSEIPLSAARTASGETMEAADLLQLLDGVRIRSVLRDSRGNLWISTWLSCGLLRYDGKTVTAFTPSDGLLSDRIRAICETEDGSILVVLTGGLNVIRGDSVAAAYGEADGIANTESLSVAAAPNGDYILGSNGGGIYIIGRDGVRCVGRKEGLSSGVVMRVKYDSARDLFWLVTSNSLSCMTSDYRVAAIKNFPYSNNFDLYENDKGDMWILSSNGIYVVPADELAANGEIRAVHYGIANGLPCIATGNSYSELTEDGDLYIAGNSGVAKVNINSSMENVSELKQAVPYVEADGKRIYPDENGDFTLPSTVRRLTLFPYVFNYSLTDPQVTYELQGFDRKTVTVARSELGPVTYTNLPGGSYHFVMELKDAMGRGSKTLSVSVVKKKAVFEQIWFYVLLVLILIGTATLIVRAYFRRKMRKLEERHREEAEKERIGNELRMATQIQASMLPSEFPPFPDRKEFDVYASMDPAREVGGDFYDFFLIDDDHLCLVMADVSGKGVPAALFMMISKVILQSYAAMGQSAGAILSKANEALCANNQLNMFVTVWLGVLEISTGRVTAANAGHEYPVLKRAGGAYELYKDKHGFVLGGMDDMIYQEYELRLGPGDRLFLYTDGVPEATNAQNELFGTERMVEALNRLPDAPTKQVLENVRKEVDEFVREAEQFDDLTMLCLEYRGQELDKQQS